MVLLRCDGPGAGTVSVRGIAGIVSPVTSPDVPLLVFGPRSESYDFGPTHPLTPLRFGPGIDLLRAVGAEPGLAPEPAADDDLLAIHDQGYLRLVQRASADPSGPSAAGIGPGDVPAFAGMHDAGAMVAGGSLLAMESILRGDVPHAFHPGGGLHHAMPGRAAGFCIYNDPALAIARARRDGFRVLYVDLDVHHGDGVETIHADDPGVLTVSFHESGQHLFPGTGALDVVGEGVAAGTIVNVPLEPGTGEGGWLRAVERLLPELAAAFGPDVVVSQHGCDTHAWDPLAHLRLTTTAMGAAARLVDRIAHRWAGGRWLATGGGGYDVFRVVPRAWALTWLAGAHREIPGAIPKGWRARWSDDALRRGTYPLPEHFEDAPNAGSPMDGAQVEAEMRAGATTELVRRLAVPALLATAVDRGWWSPMAAADGGPAGAAQAPGGGGTPTFVPRMDRAAWASVRVAAGVLAPAAPDDVHALVGAALGSTDNADVRVTAALADGVLVGAAISMVSTVDAGVRTLVALGVAPDHRRAGMARRLLAAHLDDAGERMRWEAMVGVGERDVGAPLDVDTRFRIALTLLEERGFEVRQMGSSGGGGTTLALVATRG